MSIGEALADARRRAGLSVTQVSQKTRIRESIIRDIEQGDFSTCGGDFYARGHIRAIAGATGADPRPLIDQYDEALRVKELAAAGAELARAPARVAERRGINWSLILGVLVVAALGFAGYLFVSGSGHPAGGGARAKGHQHGHSGAPAGLAGSHAHPGHHGQRAPEPVPLTPVAATAFGPGGRSDGDDPQQAPLAIDASAGTAWHTDWYATAAFGDLQRGTGLLLDLGKPMMVTGVQVELGQVHGAGLELRAGDSASPAALPVVASRSAVGGQVALSVPQPVRARYWLVWFTKLPQDSAGTFLGSIYNVRITGLGTGRAVVSQAG